MVAFINEPDYSCVVFIELDVFKWNILCVKNRSPHSQQQIRIINMYIGMREICTEGSERAAIVNAIEMVINMDLIEISEEFSKRLTWASEIFTDSIDECDFFLSVVYLKWCWKMLRRIPFLCAKIVVSVTFFI